MNSSPDSSAHLNPWAIVVYAALMQAVVVGSGIYAFAFFVVPWMQAFNLDTGALMLVVTGSSIMAALISPLCGALIDKRSSRRLVVGTSVLFAVGLALIGLLPSYVTVLAVYILVLPVGLCLAGTLMALTLIGKLFIHNRGLALGLVSIGSNVGGLALPLLVTFLLTMLPWQQVFLVLAAAVVVFVSLPAIIVLKGVGGQAAVTSNLHANLESTSNDHIAAGSPPKGGSTIEGVNIMRSSAVLKLGVAYLVPCFLFVAVLHNIGALAADLGLEQQRAALATAAASIAMGLSKVVAGILSDKYGHAKLYIGCMLLITMGLVVISRATGLTGLLLGICLTAVVMGAIAPLVGTIVADRWGAALFGRVMGIVQAFAGASVFGALLAGYLREVSGSYADTFMWLLLAVIPALYCFLTMPKQTAPLASAAPHIEPDECQVG